MKPATPDIGGMLAAAPPTDPMLGGSRTPNPLQPRVILVDDDVDRRTRLGAVLDNAADVDLIGTASDAASTSALLLVLGPSGPDIALVALDPPSGKSAAVVARLRAQHAHLRVWTYGQPRGRAATAGADGVLAESTLLEDLRWALRS